MTNDQDGTERHLNLGPGAVEKAKKAAEVLGQMPPLLSELLECDPPPIASIDDIRGGADLFGHWPIKRGPLTRTEEKALFCDRLYLPGEEQIPYIQLLVEFNVTNGRGYSPSMPIPVIEGPDYYP